MKWPNIAFWDMEYPGHRMIQYELPHYNVGTHRCSNFLKSLKTKDSLTIHGYTVNTWQEGEKKGNLFSWSKITLKISQDISYKF